MKAQQIYAKLLDEINLHEDEIKRIKQRANDLFVIFGDDLKAEVEQRASLERPHETERRVKLSAAAKARWAARRAGKVNGKANGRATGKANGKGANFSAGDWTEDENDKILNIVKAKQPVLVRDVALEVSPKLKHRTMGGILQHIAKMNELKISKKKEGSGMPKLMAEVAA